MDTMFPNSLEIGDSDDNGMTDIVCLGVGLVAMAFWPEHAKSIVTACNAHDQLTAENATLRADLNDARSNWESGAEELRQADLVREQLVDFLRDIDLIEHPDAGDHNPLCQGGEQNVTVLDAIIARARKLQSALTAVGAADLKGGA